MTCLLGVFTTWGQPLLSASAEACKHTGRMNCSITAGSCYSETPPMHISHAPFHSTSSSLGTQILHLWKHCSAPILWGRATPARRGGREHSVPAHHPPPAGQVTLAQVEDISEPPQGSQNKLGLSSYMGSLRNKSPLKEMVGKDRA